MAVILFNDGKTQEVDYNQAAKIHQILNNEREPKDAAQEAFCLRVAAVRFDPIPEPKSLKEPLPLKEDVKLQKMLKDEKLKGYAKFVAIGNRLKERQTP